MGLEESKVNGFELTTIPVTAPGTEQGGTEAVVTDSKTDDRTARPGRACDTPTRHRPRKDVVNPANPPVERRRSPRPVPTLGDADRQASLDAMLAGWDGDSPVWVFGYGSLIWKPEFAFDRKARGRAFGYHRSLCLWSHVYRGTPETPGLVLGLEPGGSVHGVAFRIPAHGARRHLEALWSRELVTGSYVPRWLDVRIDDPGDGLAGRPAIERVPAIAFVMDRKAPGYAGELDRGTLLDTVCRARGRAGSCADYVLFTVQSLNEHAIHDRHLAKLAEEVGVKIALPRHAGS